MTDVILTVNVGSSSVKCSVHDLASSPVCLRRGEIAGIGSLSPTLAIGELTEAPPGHIDDHASALEALICRLIEAEYGWRVHATVHRIVHGGTLFTAPAPMTEHALGLLEAFIPFAPLHQPRNLNAVRHVMHKYPDAHHVGCFDTAFHSTLPELASAYALPKRVREKGFRRYGFHGLSYQSILHRLNSEHAELVQAPIIIAHLGSGSSLCAVRDGRSVATTMGLTALDGVPMGTRSGSIDPGLVLLLARDPQFGVDRTEWLLYKDSGLKGLSGLSGDLRELRAAKTHETAFALEYYAERIAQSVAALSVPLGGLEALVFTGGIGANDDAIRSGIVQRLSHMSSFKVLAFQTDEEGVMAREAAALLSSGRFPTNPLSDQGL